MSVDGQRAHRPGLFKLSQKKHSTGRHRSKRAIARETRGKVGIAQIQQSVKEARKHERRNRLAQIRANKAAKVLEQKRHERDAPTVITIISLDDNCTAHSLVEALIAADTDASVSRNESKNILHLGISRFKNRYTFLSPDCSSVCETLDCLRASEMLLLLWPLGVDSIKPSQERLLSSILAQGTPQVINIVSGLLRCGKQRDSMRKSLDKAMSNWTKDSSRVFELNDANQGLQLLRHISTMKKPHSNLQRMKPYLLAENVLMLDDAEDSQFCTLAVTGYLRGTPLSINNLVHISGMGDFQLDQIETHPDPHPLKPNKGEMAIVLKPDPSKQTPLDSEITPDPMDSEQPAVDDDQQKFAVPKLKKCVPKGTSDYQASWLIDEEKDDDDEEEEDEGSDDEEDCQESDENQSEADSKGNFEAQMEDESEEEDEGDNISTSAMDTEEDVDDDGAENEALNESEMEQFKQEREDCKWPDEVETPRNIHARERFQRYRALKSFRTSPWDPKENLPLDYARIYKVVDFKRTQKTAVAEAQKAFEVEDNNEYCFPGSFVTLHVKNVPKLLCEGLRPESPLIVFGLLRQEHRMTVLNMVLKKHPACTLPIKNKEQLVFQVGCRRLTANPLFSQHTNGQKFKMERFMPTSGAFCATIFAPITFRPANVVVFRQMASSDSLQLVAHGVVLDVNPDRIVLKRAILSGHPFKVNKRTAIVRYMFFNREDIEWFKPVELYTHNGRHGRIKQALGTHGHIKCTFDQPLKVQDTVLMNLYKRVFPKWTYGAALGQLNCQMSSMADGVQEKNKRKSGEGKQVQFSDGADETMMIG